MPVKSTALKAVLSFVAAGYKREGSGDKKEMYKNTFKVLELVNRERRKEGLSDLVMDQSLLETAMLRGFENVIYWSHTRPDGEECFSANSRMMGENIATGQTSPEQVMNAWMNSSGH